VVGNVVLTVPATVLKYSAYQHYMTRVTLGVSNASVVSGSHTYWQWSGPQKLDLPTNGVQSTPITSFPETQTQQKVRFALSDGSKARIDLVKIEYKYAILG
jgi:hypothetical protein